MNFYAINFSFPLARVLSNAGATLDEDEEVGAGMVLVSCSAREFAPSLIFYVCLIF